jgi:Fungal N-terminal domain of STAND proteins
MDDVGFAASIVDLLALSKSIIDYIKDVKDANEDRQKLLEETIATQRILSKLETTANQDAWKATMEVLTGPLGPFEQLRDVLKRMESTLKPAKGKFSKISNSLIWPFLKDEINNLLSKIKRIQHLFNLALQNENLYVQSKRVANFRTLIQAIKVDMKSMNVKLGALQISRESMPNVND